MKYLILMLFLLSQFVLAQEQPIQSIAFGSCLHQDKPQPIWETVTAEQPELFVFLGDTIYGDTTDMNLLAHKYAKQFNHPDFLDFRTTFPYVGTWDDHDYGANDAGIEWPYKEESKRLMLDFLGEPPDTPRRQRPGVYTSYVYGPVGQRVQVILLDTRWFRSKLYRLTKAAAKARNEATGKGPYLPSPEPDAQMLGQEQWDWLRDQLQQPADVRLIASSIPVIQEGSCWETWDNFPQERDRFYQLLKETKAQGVILLSGDSHRAEFSRVDNKISYPLWELNSSGLTENARSRPPNLNRLGSMFMQDNFGVIRFNWEVSDPQIMMEIRDVKGQLVRQNMIRISELR